jgi:tetratricopeptide (TPR) repeat protein
MKRFVVLVLVALCLVLPGALGQGLDDEYVQIFGLIQEADTLSDSAPSQALAKYLDAQAALDRLHKGSPDWNTRIVNYRLTYLANRIATLSATTSAPPPVKIIESKGTALESNVAPERPTPPEDWQAQSQALRGRIGQLQSEKALMEAKLKEALAMRPSAADPSQLARAEDQIKVLQKENELLKVGVEKQKQAAPAPDQSARMKQLENERNDLQKQLETATKQRNSHKTKPDAPQVQDLENQLALGRTRLDALQKENELLKVSVEKQKQVSPPADQSARIKQLESERNDLQKQLEAVTREKAGRKAKPPAPQVQELENQLALARTRLDALEARTVPYTSEELELLKRPETKLKEPDPRLGKKSVKELPPGSAALVADAQRYFAAKQFDKAEAAYQQVLQQDPKNVPALANLAAIQVEAEQFQQADLNIKQALAQEPQDSFSLYVLGILRFRQAKYDDALDALSHAAKLDPQNAEVQNYLGLALSEKGLRVPAEAALRKAVQLQPGYGGAHYNLAVVYATQHPPATELARWHYQKAIAAGHPRNADLEKRFENHQ